MSDDTITEGQFQILPPAKHLCQVCAVDHAPSQPHNPESLFYQVSFNLKHGRGPTWADAMEHCDEDTKAKWTTALSLYGIYV